jgi:transposase
VTTAVMVQDESVSTEGPRAGGPRRRRAFTVAEKIEHLAAYEAACTASEGGGGAYLREQGVYSSQITQWRQLRDAGLLAGKKPGEKVGRPTADQAEIARLTRELEIARRRLATTEAALGIMGKAHALLEQISESADIEDQRRRR